MTSISERVARGVEWLDETHPGWVKRIDLDRLDIGDCERCLIGQTIGDFCEAPDLPFDEMGFVGPDDHALEVEWRRVITERREAAPHAGS